MEGMEEYNSPKLKQGFKKSNVPPNPLPWGKLLGPLLLLFCESFNITQIFSYLGYLVLSFGISDKEEEVGYYAGYIASSFSLAQFLSSFFWGRMSDKYGRRPILLLGSVGSMISSLTFGFSSSLPFAIIARSINGLLNGNMGVVKTYIGEVTDDTNQIKAFSLVGLCWGSGTVIGPILGGFLANPSEKMPSLFPQGSFLDRFPFLLPNLVASAITLVGLIIAYFKLLESRSPEIQMKILHHSKKRKMKRDINSKYVTLKEDSIQESGMEREDSFHINDSQKQIFVNTAINDLNSIHLLDIKEEIGDGNKTTFFSWISKKIHGQKNVHTVEYKDLNTLEDEKKDQYESIFKQKLVLITTIIYAMLGFNFTMFDEVWPLWAIATVEKGGLGFTSNEIGLSGTIAGVFILIAQTTVYPLVSYRLGIVNTFRLGVLLCVPMFLLYPLVPFAFESNSIAWLYITLALAILFKVIVGQLVFTSVMNLVNNSAFPSSKGAVNGLGQSLVAFTRALAPSLGANILAWSLSIGASRFGFPLDRFLVFIILAILSFVLFCFTLKLLPQSLNVPLQEPDDEFDDDDDENISISEQTETTETENGDESKSEIEISIETNEGKLDDNNNDNDNDQQKNLISSSGSVPLEDNAFRKE